MSPARNGPGRDAGHAQGPDNGPPVPAERLPGHIAIIMDGNGRWARQHGLPRHRGHEAGVEAVRRVVRTASAWGVEVLTLYAFSTENWRRSRAEVATLMRLLQRYLRRELQELQKNGVSVRAIGQVGRLPGAAREELDRAQERTRHNPGLKLVLALSYGGRDEIVRAARSLARAAAEGRLDPDDLDADRFAAALDTAGLPDPDLLIRTAGEMRISNFLLWQASYAEYYSTNVLWPDFDRDALAQAVAAYARRTRTFGERHGQEDG